MTDKKQKAAEYRKRYYDRNKEKIATANCERYRKAKEADPIGTAAKTKAYQQAWEAKSPGVVKKLRVEQQQTPSYVAYRILHGMRKRSKEQGWDWDDGWWSVSTIEHIITTQRCAVTGMVFEFKEAVNGKSHPFKPSPDRFNNELGYHPDNVQFVVWMYNLMKSAYNAEYVETFVSSIVQFQNESNKQEKVRTEDIVGH